MADLNDMPRKPVLVLGASGFIGRKVVAALRADPRYRPIEASRRSAGGIQSVDATDRDAVVSAIRNVDYVVNCVAGGNRTLIASTQAVCDAARREPPRRILHLSSMAVYGAATGSVAEDHAAVAPVGGYGNAKAVCERIVRKYVVDGGDAVILRPTCVFGPHSSQWTTRLGHLLKQGRLGDLGLAGDGRCNLAFIDDVATGIVNALGSDNASGRAFNISSSSALTWNEFLVRFAKALEATPVRRIPQRTLAVETKILAPVRRIAAMGLNRIGLRAGESITPSLLALMGQDIRIDCSAAIETFGLPQTPVEQMTTVAAAWLNGLAPVSSQPDSLMEPARS